VPAPAQLLTMATARAPHAGAPAGLRAPLRAAAGHRPFRLPPAARTLNGIANFMPARLLMCVSAGLLAAGLA